MYTLYTVYLYIYILCLTHLNKITLETFPTWLELETIHCFQKSDLYPAYKSFKFIFTNRKKASCIASFRLGCQTPFHTAERTPEIHCPAMLWSCRLLGKMPRFDGTDDVHLALMMTLLYSKKSSKFAYLLILDRTESSKVPDMVLYFLKR